MIIERVLVEESDTKNYTVENWAGNREKAKDKFNK